MKTKICTKCKIEQDICEFKKYTRSKDKLDYWCRACNFQSSTNWLANNPNKRKKYSKASSEREKVQRRDPETRDRILEYSRTYYQRNKQRINNKYKTDLHFKITSLLRSRIRYALKKYDGVKKAAKTTELVGCSIEALRFHLESQFTKGMTWENQGEWHIDHIKPCAFFDLTDIEQQKQCFHYTNLQPLWGPDNLSKGAIYEGVNSKYEQNNI